jgi:hypothetical protein
MSDRDEFEKWFVNYRVAYGAQYSDDLEGHVFEAWQAATQATEAKILAQAKQIEIARIALQGLIDDLNKRAIKYNEKDAQGVVACGNGVWMRANEALASLGEHK